MAEMMARRIEELQTPAFVVDLPKVRNNAAAMIERFRNTGVRLRPHMKTHKTVECADIMTGGSRRCIVVSTLAEAFFYAEHGFDDILYAYPLPVDKLARCAELAQRLALFHVLVDSVAALQELRNTPLTGGKLWSVWLKLDCENKRAGVPHDDPAALDLAKAISESPGVELTGVYAHCGNSYDCTGLEEIHAVAQATTTATLRFMDNRRMRACSRETGTSEYAAARDKPRFWSLQGPPLRTTLAALQQLLSWVHTHGRHCPLQPCHNPSRAEKAAKHPPKVTRWACGGGHSYSWELSLLVDPEEHPRPEGRPLLVSGGRVNPRREAQGDDEEREAGSGVEQTQPHSTIRASLVSIMPIHIVKKEAEEEDEGDDESVESGGEGEESGEESEIDRRDSEYQQSSEDRDRMDPNDSEYRPNEEGCMSPA
ncbi:D-serine dehydratase [Acipenser ruthenus]|uniref:D-serine dehydratase n=1 Tax=Acipenser ruthenus TaxID=7906 RepID=A0A444TYT7_ACIRT|nr:D-serine dehydratase [Acipenser ruthenus]